MSDAPPFGRLTVFTGSSDGADPRYRNVAREVAADLARRGIGIVYGGGEVGLMGAVAAGARDAGGEVIGVMPQSLVDAELADTEITRLEVVPDMHARKLRMAELGDAFVALPGGAGTLEEFFEAWTWQQIGLHTKPVGLLDVGGFWQPMLAALDGIVEAGFLPEPTRSGLTIATDADSLLAGLANWTPPPPKWQRNPSGPAR